MILVLIALGIVAFGVLAMRRAPLWQWAAAAAVLGLAALGGELADFRFLELGAGEIIYRGYMAFYGLFFPGYVLLVMICRADLRLYWLACLLALPFFALGFLAGLMPWTAGGVLILLAAAVVAKVRRVPVA